MLSRTITLPELALISGTRAMAGVGIGLLLADHLEPQQKRTLGWTLLAVGVLTTIPLAAEVLSHHAPSASSSDRNKDEPSARQNEMSASRA
jgi:hypothetical protein